MKIVYIMQVCKIFLQTCMFLFASLPVENKQFINMHNTKY